MEENIHPLKFIAQTFNKSLADVARELGVTRQTINEWVGKKRKPIPEKRIKQLAEIFDLDESWFRKQELKGSEIIELQRIFLERNAEFYEVEWEHMDEDGNTYTIAEARSDELDAANILYFEEEKQRLLEDISSIYDEPDGERILEELVLLFSTKKRAKIRMLKDVLEFLAYYDHEFSFYVLDKEVEEKLNDLYQYYTKTRQ